MGMNPGVAEQLMRDRMAEVDRVVGARRHPPAAVGAVPAAPGPAAPAAVPGATHARPRPARVVGGMLMVMGRRLAGPDAGSDTEPDAGRHAA
jgi:hypothetical protein